MFSSKCFRHSEYVCTYVCVHIRMYMHTYIIIHICLHTICHKLLTASVLDTSVNCTEHIIVSVIYDCMHVFPTINIKL